jgi:hypothetical protein
MLATGLWLCLDCCSGWRVYSACLLWDCVQCPSADISRRSTNVAGKRNRAPSGAQNWPVSKGGRRCHITLSYLPLAFLHFFGFSSCWRTMIGKGKNGVVWPSVAGNPTECCDQREGATVHVSDIPAVPVLSQSSGKPNSPSRSVSAPRDPAERVGAGSCTQIGDLDVVGAFRIPGPG